nr:MAG TPA: hypothetical protein [Caudoviricetes sp.]
MLENCVISPHFLAFPTTTKSLPLSARRERSRSPIMVFS